MIVVHFSSFAARIKVVFEWLSHDVQLLEIAEFQIQNPNQLFDNGEFVLLESEKVLKRLLKREFPTLAPMQQQSSLEICVVTFLNRLAALLLLTLSNQFSFEKPVVNLLNRNADCRLHSRSLLGPIHSADGLFFLHR